MEPVHVVREVVMKTMKAVVIRSYGGREVLAVKDLPVPVNGEDELLVKVHGAGINPIDWKVRAGYLKEMLPYTLPLIPGWDVSGTVVRAGSAVKNFQPGDAVYALADITRNGACAEYITLKAENAAFKPGLIDHVHASAVPMAALTAWQALFDHGKLQKGQRVLVQAAAGGVGTFAVQFARWKGAYTIGTASLRNRDFLLDLGVDEVIDYMAAPFEEAVREVDLVLESMGGEVQERSWKTIRKGGTLVSLLGPPDQEMASRAQARGVGVFVRSDPGQLAAVGELIDQGRITPVVTEVLPLDDVARAHEMSETHHVRGKIVLNVSDS